MRGPGDTGIVTGKRPEGIHLSTRLRAIFAALPHRASSHPPCPGFSGNTQTKFLTSGDILDQYPRMDRRQPITLILAMTVLGSSCQKESFTQTEQEWWRLEQQKIDLQAQVE